MTKKKKTLIIRILLFGATEISLFFVPWILVKAWILPLPDTIQEQVDETIGHGFDGMIVYVDQEVIERIGTALLESMNEQPVKAKKSAEKEDVS